VKVVYRKCVGDQFALMEGVVALAVLLKRFTFRAVPGADPGMTTGNLTSINVGADNYFGACMCVCVCVCVFVCVCVYAHILGTR
jgi:hypothetical protein